MKQWNDLKKMLILHQTAFSESFVDYQIREPRKKPLLLLQVLFFPSFFGGFLFVFGGTDFSSFKGFFFFYLFVCFFFLLFWPFLRVFWVLGVGFLFCFVLGGCLSFCGEIVCCRWLIEDILFAFICLVLFCFFF